MTEVKVKVMLSVDRMAVWILPPCSQQRMAAQKWIMGKLGHSDHAGLPMGPVTITVCSVAEECLHFPVSSTKSLTSPWEKKKSCLSPAWYLYHVLQSHWAHPTCREQQQFLAVPSLHQKDCKWSRDVSKWESHAYAQVALAASQHVNCLLTWPEKAIKILLGLWASLSRGALLKPRWDWLCPRKYHKCKR